jgi:hypothetical protein
MSYSLTITHDADGLRLEPVSEQALQHVPLGTITVSGHDVKSGESGTNFVQVSVKGEDGYYLGANANAPRDRRQDVAAADEST